MALQHQRIDPLHFLRQRSEGNGTGDIRRTIEILRTTVEQQQPAGFQGDIRLWCRLIMNDGPMRPIARDGIKGDTPEERLLSTKAL